MAGSQPSLSSLKEIFLRNMAMAGEARVRLRWFFLHELDVKVTMDGNRRSWLSLKVQRIDCFADNLLRVELLAEESPKVDTWQITRLR